MMETTLTSTLSMVAHRRALELAHLGEAVAAPASAEEAGTGGDTPPPLFSWFDACCRRWLTEDAPEADAQGERGSFASSLSNAIQPLL